MTDDDDDVTVPGDHEVIAELRRHAAIAGAANAPERRHPIDDVTLEAEPAVIAEIRAAAAEAAEPEPEAPEPTPLPPPQLGTLPPPGGPARGAGASRRGAGGRTLAADGAPAGGPARRAPPDGPGEDVRARWYIVLAVAAAALVTGPIFSLRDDGDDEPAPATTEVVTTTSQP